MKLGFNEMAEKILKKGSAKVEIDTKMLKEIGHNALQFASRRGYWNIVKILLDMGKINVDQKTKAGQTALHMAAEKGHIEVVTGLIMKGNASVNIQSPNGQTALHLAAQNGHADVVEYLVNEAGANVRIKDTKGHTALHYASFQDNLMFEEQFLTTLESASIPFDDTDSEINKYANKDLNEENLVFGEVQGEEEAVDENIDQEEEDLENDSGEVYEEMENEDNYEENTDIYDGMKANYYNKHLNTRENSERLL